MTKSLKTIINGEGRDLNLHNNLALVRCYCLLVTSHNGLPAP